MKFSQFREYNVKNIFLEKSCTKCPGETVPRPISKKIKILYIYGSIILYKILGSLFLMYAKLRAINLY